MQALKYVGLTLLLIGCNSINNKDTLESTKKNTNTISVDSTIDHSLTDKVIDIFNIDSFLVTDSSVGIFKKGMTIQDVLQIVPESQLIKKTGYGEFKDDAYDDYEIYDEKNQHILTLTPSIQNDPKATVNRILILDKRFKTKSGIGIESTYAVLIESYKVTTYIPDIAHIVLAVEQIGAWFSINKTELEQDWWDERVKIIDKSKIPLDAHFDSFIIWWN